MNRSGRLDTDPRISRRRKAVARSKRRRFLMSAGAVVLVGVIAWAMFFSPLLHVREVKVTGARFTGEEEVIEATGLLGAERNLLLLGTDTIADRIEELPWIASADVDRMLPGTVRVRVKERSPALLLSIGAARWTIDAHGYVLATGEATEGLPVLAGVEVGDIEPGLRLVTEEAVAALKVYRGLPKTLKRRVSGLFAPTVERVSFSLVEGTVIRYGAAEDIHDKNEVLKVLLDRLRSEGRAVAYIDVRVPTSPAVSDQPAPSATPSATPSASG